MASATLSRRGIDFAQTNGVSTTLSPRGFGVDQVVASATLSHRGFGYAQPPGHRLRSAAGISATLSWLKSAMLGWPLKFFESWV
jgi:hypothetical protein